MRSETRRVDGVERRLDGTKPDSLVDFHTAWDLRREVQSIVKGQVLPHDVATRLDDGYIRRSASKHMASKINRPATASPNDTEYFLALLDQAAQSSLQ